MTHPRKKSIELEQGNKNSDHTKQATHIQECKVQVCKGSSRNTAREPFAIKHINSTWDKGESLGPPNRCPVTSSRGQKLRLIQKRMVLAVQYSISPFKDLPVLNVQERGLTAP